MQQQNNDNILPRDFREDDKPKVCQIENEEKHEN